MKLVIAEKPMLARDIARAICGILVSETERLPLSGNGYTVCACAGHLFELQDPADIDPKWGKSWTVESLPITVEDWPKVAVSDKERLVSEIQGLLQDAEMVIHAGDPDDEGQLIVDELLEALGWQGKVMRVLVNDNIEKNVQRAFTELRPNDEFENAGRAAYARQMADAAFGFTETRLATKQLGALMSVGRVQTPTLGMVVTRDEQIAGHVKQTYYELCADVRIDNVDGLHTFKFKPGKELLQDEKHLYDASALEEAKECVEKSTHVIETAHSTKTEQPPLPYNLTVLIADMSELYKMPAALTQQVTQDLRDKYKAITYNRSDCQYLKEEHFVAAEVVLGCAMKNLGVAWSLDFTCRSKAFNEKNVTAHHAIIPQEVSLTLAGMTEHEQRVYKAIVERYAMQFLAPARYEVSTSIFKTDKGHFECVYTKETDAGWKATFEKKSDKEKEKTSESLIKAGESTGEVANTTIVQKETSPPKPYTEGTLVSDMASIAKYVKDPEIKAVLKAKDEGKKGENGGIGTTATRASIIEGLKMRGYLEEISGKLRSTEKGRVFYHLLPEEIAHADTTARWWLLQQEIAEGKLDVNAIQRSVVEVFMSHKDTAYKGVKPIGTTPALCKCPRCGSEVKAYEKQVSCSTNKYRKLDDGTYEQVEGCGFKVFRTVAGKKLTDAQLKSLIEKGHTAQISGFKGKSGKSFSAALVFNTGDCSVSFRFEDKKFSQKGGKSKLKVV